MTDNMPVEVIEALIWIRARLEDNETLQNAGVTDRIHWSVAPEDEEYPFIQMEVLDQNDRLGVGPTILWSDILVLVRGVTNTASPYGLREVAKGIHEALHAQRGETDVARIVTSMRERPHIMPADVSERGTYSYLGGEYRLRVRAL